MSAYTHQKRAAGRRRVAFAFLAVASASLLAYSVWPRPRYLLNSSQRLGIAHTRGLRGYIWLDEARALLIYESSTGGGSGLDSVRMLDTRTGRIELCEPLTRVIRNLRLQGLGGLSPDCKHLMATSDRGELRYVALTLDGKVAASWPRYANTYEVCWEPDGRSWVDFFDVNGQTRAIIGTLGFSLPRELRTAKNLGVELLGIMPNGRALSLEYDANDNLHQMHCYAFSLDDAMDTKSWRIRVPTGRSTGYNGPILSPKGDRMAWILEADANSHISNLSETLLGWIGAHTDAEPWREVWTSDVHGTDWRVIGRIPISESGYGTWLQWMRQGDALSFFYDNKLYKVADR